MNMSNLISWALTETGTAPLKYSLWWPSLPLTRVPAGGRDQGSSEEWKHLRSSAALATHGPCGASVAFKGPLVSGALSPSTSWESVCRRERTHARTHAFLLTTCVHPPFVVMSVGDIFNINLNNNWERIRESIKIAWMTKHNASRNNVADTLLCGATPIVSL